jgi:hypothetical protein
MTEQRIVWQMPDGTIRVGVPTLKGLLLWGSLDRVAQRLQEAVPSLRGAKRLPDCRVADLPPKAKRHAWRARADGTLFADLTVPDPPRGKSLEERIAALEAKDAGLRP